MELTPEKSATRIPRRTLICVLVLLVLFGALCVRVPYGLDWTDEPYYSVLPYRLALGDRPFIDTWEVHQLSGLLTLPLMETYLIITGGSTDGVMLFFRYALIVCQLFISLYAYFVLRRSVRDVAALIAAGLLLMHVHFGLNGLSYNTMAPMLLALSVLLTFDALDGRYPIRKTLLAGAVYALSVQAYPYGALTLPAYLLFWLLHARRTEDVREKRLGGYFALGAAVAFAAFLTFVAVRSAPAEVWENLACVFHDPDHQAQSALLLLAQYANAVRVLFGPVFLAAALLTVYAVCIRFVKDAHIRLRLTQLGFAASIAVLLASIVWIIPYDYPNHHKINLVAMSPILILPAVHVLSGFRKSRYLLPAALGVLLSLAVQLGSNTGIRSSSGMMLLGSAGTILYLFDVLDDQLPAPFGAHTFRTVAAAVCICQLLLTSGLRIITVYRDEPLDRLTAVITEGPARGTVTSPEAAARYDALYRDVTDHAPERGNILFTNLLPVGYLMTTLAPATPSAFNMTADSPWLAEYYALHPERRPNCIYAADASLGQGNELSGNGVEALAERLSLEKETLAAGTMFAD